MKSYNTDTEEKRLIIKKLVSSGINITPFLLDIILDLEDPIKNINSIIKDSSFIANFKSHLTKNILNKTSNEEIKKVLKRKLMTQNTHQNKDPQTDQGISVHPPLSKRAIDEATKPEFYNEIEDLPKKMNNIDFKIESAPRLIHSKFSNKPEVTKVKLIERTKSVLKFTPSAKDYDFQFEILKDPTGKLYTNGDYKDFYDLTLDKYNRLLKLMRKRPEVHNADNINNISRLSNRVEVSVIGFVNEARITKNGNFFLTLEDITGVINILIRKDSENQETIRTIRRTLNDQMVYIEGTYNPGEKGRSGIIYGNYITKIGVPKDYEPNLSSDPLSIALISDTHIGSKEFEVKLWNRFIDFLKGKIGNKSHRDRAGRIKYLIINGDLVDGIGIYPSQENDLIISDIFQQFNKAAEFLSEVPDYIKIFYSSGNHEPVRKAIPRPAVPKKYSEDLLNLGTVCIGNPSIVQTHKVNTLVFHGDSLLDLNMLIPGLENSNPTATMEELLRCRHLAPIFGKKTQIAPTNKDWLVVDKIPDIFHTGHIHINGMSYYNRIALVNSGCFQSQTDFMNSLGIHPTPGILSLIELDSLRGIKLDLKSNV
ncbi:MAG: metallophosphoesterase [Promethearchaeota archaeon]